MVRTEHRKGVLNAQDCDVYFNIFKELPKRPIKGCSIGYMNHLIHPYSSHIDKICSLLQRSPKYGAIACFFSNGLDFFKHKRDVNEQFLLFLGEGRKIEIGRKAFYMSNGDVLIFGKGQINVPIEMGFNHESIIVVISLS